REDGVRAGAEGRGREGEHRARRGDARVGVAVDVHRVRVAVREPFRLDLTVAMLQRLPVHPVEVWVPGATATPTATSTPGRYLRAFSTPRGPVNWTVTP